MADVHEPPVDSASDNRPGDDYDGVVVPIGATEPPVTTVIVLSYLVCGDDTDSEAEVITATSANEVGARTMATGTAVVYMGTIDFVYFPPCGWLTYGVLQRLQPRYPKARLELLP